MAVSDKEIRDLKNGISELKKDLASAENSGNPNSTYAQTIRQAIAEDQARLDRLMAQQQADRGAQKRADQRARLDAELQRPDLFAGINNKAELRKERNRLAKMAHPDVGGSQADMDRINREYAAAEARLNAQSQQQQQSRQSTSQQHTQHTQNTRSHSTSRQQPSYEPEYEDSDYDEEPIRASRSSGDDRLAIEKERTRRQQLAQKETTKRQQERYRLERQRYNRYRRREARRAVTRSAVRGSQQALVASHKQKYAQAQTGGLRIPPEREEPRLIDKLPASTNPAYAGWAGVGTGGLLLFTTTGPTLPLVVTAVAGLAAWGVDNQEAKEVAIGAAFGSGLLGLIRLLGKGGANGK